MKARFRITKGRVALAMVLLPILYVLNAGPLMYCYMRFGFPPIIIHQMMYYPLRILLSGSRLSNQFEDYLDWWILRGAENKVETGSKVDFGPVE